jgi:hypothetical protein
MQRDHKGQPMTYWGGNPEGQSAPVDRLVMPPIEPRGVLPLDWVISAGFGTACVTCDGETIWQHVSDADFDTLWTVLDAEHEAMKLPEKDWRIHVIRPLYEGHWQRQSPGEWVLYKKGHGFA